MTILRLVWYIIQFVIGYNLLLPFLLWLLWLIKRPKKRTFGKIDESDYGIIVTAYEQTHMLPAVVDSLLKMDHSNYIVYIVADKCDISNLNFSDSRIILLRPEQILASNTASHEYALRNFIRSHERVTIIDSDNLVEPSYLTELDIAFNGGYAAVQGLRDAKNLDTTIACLDAARDIYYHFYDGKVLFQVGSSATLSGSGMAFETSLYREFLQLNDVKGAGFDKVLQNFILKKGLRIAFSGSAVVYDEKTSKTDQLVNQRSRWINTWFKYFSLGFGLIGRGLSNANFNQLLFGVILLRPPLFIFLLFSVMFMLVNVIVEPWLAAAWLGSLIIFTLGFLIALSSSETDPRIYASLKNIPIFIYHQIRSLLKSRTANQRSVATTHYHSDSSVQVKKVQNEN